MNYKQYISPVVAVVLLLSTTTNASDDNQDQQHAKTHAYFTFVNQDPNIDKPSRLYNQKIDDLERAASAAGLREFKITDKNLGLMRYSETNDGKYEISFSIGAEFVANPQGYDAFMDVDAAGISFTN